MTVTISDAARKKIAEVIRKAGQPIKGLRIMAVPASPLKVEYQLALVKEEGGDSSENTVYPVDGFDVYVESKDVLYVDGSEIDYIENMMGGGFRIEAPPGLVEQLGGPLAAKIQRLLDEQINPGLGGHGGYVNLIDVRDNVAYVEMGGGCQGCSMARATLKEGVEVIIKENVPEITEVYDTTDHASGQNPYYQGEG